MRQLRINTICTVSITASIFIIIAILIAYVSSSSYRMVSGVQSASLDQTAMIVAQSAENYIEQSVSVAKSLAGGFPLSGVIGRAQVMDAIGPGGLGGTTTVLAVHVNTYPTHIAGLPVAVNICCHVNRHAIRTI
mgnify:CR=1 FL=1